jgi:hypothetical protein
MPIAHKLHIANLCLFLLLLTLPRVHHQPSRGGCNKHGFQCRRLSVCKEGDVAINMLLAVRTMLFQLDAICIVHGVVAVIARRLQ